MKYITKAIIALALMALGAFAWVTLSPLFITIEVDEPLPESLTQPAPTPETPNTTPLETSAEPAQTPPVITTETAGEAQRTVQEHGPFPIVGTPGHRASGDIRILKTPEEQIIRFENYDGTNGPDLHIYLANDLQAQDFITLGDARGNKGNVNYGVPLDVNISDYKYVMTWCKDFGVLFDYAEIN